MYRVAIIDDEPIITEGLSRVVPWEKYGCQVIGTAYNGNEGMKLIREQKPDLIISDISMPNRNGLEMIAGIRSEFPDLMVTILTGYRNFEYAQEAIRLGVVRYLLKPSKFDEIGEAVEAMVEKLKERQAKEEEPEAAGPEEEAAAADAGSFIVKNAVTYMEEHYNEHLTLSEVADRTYVSQWHLSKLINRHTEKSFSELLNSIRIREAKRLLRDPSMRIGDIAEAVGFMDTAHFSRVFKKIAGISANEYRNRKLG